MALAAVPLMGLGGVAGAAARGVHSTKSLVRVVVLGDSTAYTLAFSLGVLKLDDKYHDFLQDRGNIGCGLITGPEERIMGVPYYPKSDCNGSPATPGEPFDAQPLKVKWASALAQYHPNVVVLLAGRWEIVDRVYNGAWTNILVPSFAAYVQQQLEAASNMFTATGANVVFLTAPCSNEQNQPDGQPWPENDPARLAAYNALLQKVAAEYPRTDSVVDLNGLVCPKGVYTADYKGVTIREPDGIHFTDEAGIALAPALLPPILAAGRAALVRHHEKRTTRSSKP
jgi:SGNH domain (fused to AT3 domains)